MLGVSMFLIGQCATIYDIQQPADPANGVYDSQCLDSTVTIAAKVLYYNGGGFNFYVFQEPYGPYQGLLVYRGSVTLPANLSTGDSVIITGTVQEYYGNTEISLTADVIIVDSGHPIPSPILITAAHLDTTASSSMFDMQPDTAESYEHVLVRLENVYVVDVVTIGSGTYAKVTDGTGYTYIGTGSITYNPTVGDLLNAQGIVRTYYGQYVVEPRNDADIEVLTLGLNAAFAISRDQIKVMYTTDVSGNSEVVDPANYTLNPALNITAANYDPDDPRAVILTTDPQTDGQLYTIYVNLSTLQDSFKFYGGIMPITQIQSNFVYDSATRDFPSVYADSAYPVTVAGVITGWKDKFPSPWVFIQEASQPYAGMLIWGLGTSDVVATEGDSLIVTGYVTEYNGLTEIADLLYTRVVSGPFPYEPVIASPSALTFTNDSSEMYEDVFVRVDSVYVIDTAGNNVTVTSYPPDTLVYFEVNKEALTNIVLVPGMLMNVQGPVRRIYGTVTIYPRSDADVDSLAVGIAENAITPAFRIVRADRSGIEISYNLPVGGNFDVEIYSVAGRLLASRHIDAAERTGTIRIPVTLRSGIYVVRAGKYTSKVVVR